MAIALFLHIHCCEALHAIATTLLYVQTADKWLTTTFNSLNACACGGAELHTMAMVAMEDFQKLGKRAVVFSADHPACPEQKDGRTCGMCIIGFALTVILQHRAWTVCRCRVFATPQGQIAQGYTAGLCSSSTFHLTTAIWLASLLPSILSHILKHTISKSCIMSLSWFVEGEPCFTCSLPKLRKILRKVPGKQTLVSA